MKNIELIRYINGAAHKFAAKITGAIIYEKPSKTLKNKEVISSDRNNNITGDRPTTSGYKPPTLQRQHVKLIFTLRYLMYFLNICLINLIQVIL